MVTGWYMQVSEVFDCCLHCPHTYVQSCICVIIVRILESVICLHIPSYVLPHNNYVTNLINLQASYKVLVDWRVLDMVLVLFRSLLRYTDLPVPEVWTNISYSWNPVFTKWHISAQSCNWPTSLSKHQPPQWVSVKIKHLLYTYICTLYVETMARE